ncbi:hypothetical protein RRG08_040863 [Elysia crispata]|uniref:Uncharacterized protein n=1 Tax=Elysia crispata TaxID=231223 RepID=A0AAE1AZK6_9GAST|nr:hypothetical protein RRG08_040863 [Elysia crispata]
MLRDLVWCLPRRAGRVPSRLPVMPSGAEWSWLSYSSRERGDQINQTRQDCESQRLKNRGSCHIALLHGPRGTWC